MEREMETRQGLRAFAETTKKLFGEGGNSMVRVHFILPHSRLADVEIRINAKSNRPFTFSNTNTDADTLINSSKNRLNATDKKTNISKIQARSTSVVNEDDNLFSKTEMSKSVSLKQRKISIKVMGHNQYAANDPSVLLGLHGMEIRLLKQLGYEVYLIDPSAAQSLDCVSDVRRLEYVEQLLLKTCCISLSWDLF